jgi:membrane associated rhomboid family serine protease
MLYRCLGDWSIAKRLGSLVLCSVFSLGAALLASSMPNGLCGLSGIAHGLMAIAALQMTREKTALLRTAGLISFILVVAKSIYEGITGQICFEFLHFGSVGEAIAVCHTGGVLGGICAYLVFRKAPSAARSTDRPEFDQSDQTDRTN